MEVKYDDIISVENLLLAWEEFLRGKRKRKDVQESVQSYLGMLSHGNAFKLKRKISELL